MKARDIDEAVGKMTVIVDTREQDTVALRNRLQHLGAAYVRHSLSVGDYSARYTLGAAETEYLLPVAIERKMSLDELAACFTSERARFEREMERAKDFGTRMYLLIENGSWEKIYGGKYQSRIVPAALGGSLLAWMARYDLRIVFCKAETTGKLIGDILRHELVEVLKNHD